VKELLGGCLQAAGILIAGLTGLCTLVMLASVRSGQDFLVAIGSTLFYCIPFAIGVGLILVGRALVRSARSGRY
jgi:hypothetical protein